MEDAGDSVTKARSNLLEGAGSASSTPSEAMSNLSVGDASSDTKAQSKNAAKKAEKLKKKEEKDAMKAQAAAAAPSSAKAQKPQVADDEDMDPTQYFENRLKALAAQKTAGINPYPHKFEVSLSISEYIDKYKSLNNGEHLEDVVVSLAGRIMNKRSSSSKLFFYDLHGSGGKIQVMADARYKVMSGVMLNVIVSCRQYQAKCRQWGLLA